MTPQELKDGLANFTGTTQHIQYSPLYPRWLLTDGTKWLADNAGCYWLMDLIASHGPAIRAEGFAAIKLKKTTPTDCDVAIEDGNDSVLAEQTGIFTDFPLEEITLYAAPVDERLMVIMLPSEY